MANEKHLLLSIRGDYRLPALDGEQWQCGIRLALVFGSIDSEGTLPNNWTVAAASESTPDADYVLTKNWTANGPAADDFDPGSYLVDTVDPAVRAWLGQATISTTVGLTAVVLYPIGPDGKVIERRSARLDYSADISGGGGGSMTPPEVSIGVSWQTPVLGPKGRGRIYMPPAPAASFDTTGFVSSASRDAALAANVALLEGLSIGPGGLGAPSVRPIVTGAAAPAWSTYGVIENVRVGSVADAQRRRRNQLTEVYTEGSPDY